MEARLMSFIEGLLVVSQGGEAEEEEELKAKCASKEGTANLNHQTLVFLPVGIPGMGKTTLGRFLETASNRLN
jgi:signal recognition particle GTPase